MIPDKINKYSKILCNLFCSKFFPLLFPGPLLNYIFREKITWQDSALPNAIVSYTFYRNNAETISVGTMHFVHPQKTSESRNQ